MIDVQPARVERFEDVASLLGPGTTSMFERAAFHRVVQTSARSGGLPRWLVRRYLTSPAG